MSIEKIIERIRADALKESRRISRAFPGDDFISRLMRSHYGAQNTKQNEGRKNG